MNECQADRPVHAFWTANSVVDKVIGKAQEYSALKIGSESKKWIQGCSNEIGRLPRGVLPHISQDQKPFISFIRMKTRRIDELHIYVLLLS